MSEIKKNSTKTYTILLYYTNLCVSIGQLPSRGNLPPVRVGVWVKVRVSFRVGGNQTIVPEKSCLPVRVRIWLRVSFGVGGANFPRRQLS